MSVDIYIQTQHSMENQIKLMKLGKRGKRILLLDAKRP